MTGHALAVGGQVQGKHGAARQRIASVTEAHVPQRPQPLGAAPFQIRRSRRRFELQAFKDPS